jgi:hypothetical protein
MITPVEIAAYVSAGALAASKLLSAVKPLWSKLPRPVAVALPVVVAALPQVAAQAGLVQTGHDLVTFAVVAVAALLPGLAEKK